MLSAMEHSVFFVFMNSDGMRSAGRRSYDFPLLSGGNRLELGMNPWYCKIWKPGLFCNAVPGGLSISVLSLRIFPG